MDIGLSVLAVIRTATSETVSASHYVFINLHVIKCSVQESDSCFLSFGQIPINMKYIYNVCVNLSKQNMYKKERKRERERESCVHAQTPQKAQLCRTGDDLCGYKH